MKKIKLLLAAMAAMASLSANAWDGSEGKVYLQNVGSGLWWGAGNSWGTQASLLAHPEYVTFIADGTNFKMETQVSNGGTSYFFNGSYMDNNSPVSLTVTQVGDYYTIANGTTYYGYDGSSTVLGSGVDATTDNGKWKIYSEADMTDMLSTATVEKPVDATYLLLDPNFGRNNRNTSYKKNQYISGAWSMTASNLDKAGTNENNCVEAYHAVFTLSQAIATHPAGVYKVTAQGFYRQDGSDNANLPYFYVNDITSTFPLKTGAENSMSDASVSFTAGSYVAEPMYISVTENQGLTIGAKLETNTNLWCIWDNFIITYYGDATIAEVLLADYVKTYNQALAAAQEQQAKDMFDADKTVLNTAISENTVDLNNTTEEELTTAAANLNAAAAAAAIAATKYASYASAKAAIEAGTTNVDLTSFVANAGFELGSLTGWTSADGGNIANNNNFSRKGGTYFVERWKNNVALGDGSITHDALYLPAGTYVITADAQNLEQYNNSVGGTGLFLYANDEKTEIGDAANYFVSTVLAEDGNLIIKFVQESCTGNWISYDNITLTYYAAASDIFAAAAAAATEVLNNAANANVTGSERTALQTAIAQSPENTVAANMAAVETLNAALSVFIAAKKNYDLYTSELPIAQAISNTITVAAPTTADEALAAFKSLKVAEYNFVKDAYPYSATSKIGDFSTWTRTGTVNGAEKNEFEALTSQHWSGTARTYYEQPKTGWDNNAWTAKYEKTTTLPAGEYIIKVAARAASTGGTTASISCQGLTAPIPTLGDTGKGITTAGVASFDEGTFAEQPNNHQEGCGWIWSYLPFTLTEETEVTMTVVAAATGQHQWFSVCDGELLSKTNIATAVAYDEASANTIENVDVANVTITRTVKTGLNTVVLPFDLTASQVQDAFGSGAEVYAFSESSENANDVTVNFNKVVNGTITANVPALVKATAATNVQVFEGVQVKAPTADVKVAGTNVDFIGVYAPAAVAEGDWFIGNGKVFKSAGATNIKSFRAYIQAKTAEAQQGEVKIFIDGLATRISDISNATMSGVIYNVAGQRVNKAQKGIFIVNGKKVIK